MAIETDYTLATYNGYFDVNTANFAWGVLEAVSASEINKAAWDALTDPQKEILIMTSSLRISTEFDWAGSMDPAIIAPTLNWPRVGLKYTNGVSVSEGTPLPSGFILAIAYLMDFMLKNGYTSPLIEKKNSVQNKTVGGVSVTYTASSAHARANKILFDITKYIPSSWLAPSVMMGIGSVGKLR